MRSGGGTDGPGGPGLVVWTGMARAARDGELCLLGHPPTPSGDGDPRCTPPRQLLRGVALRLARSCSLHMRAATRAGGSRPPPAGPPVDAERPGAQVAWQNLWRA